MLMNNYGLMNVHDMDDDSMDPLWIHHGSSIIMHYWGPTLEAITTLEAAEPVLSTCNLYPRF